MIQAGRLDRTFYTKLIFDNYATGNAVVVVALVYVVVAVVRPFLELGAFVIALAPLVGLLVNGAVAWLLLTLVSWFVGVRLLGGHSQLTTAIRVTGFAHVPLLATAVPALLVTLAAMVWFVAALMVALEAALSLDRRPALGAAVAGFLGWLLLFGRSFL